MRIFQLASKVFLAFALFFALSLFSFGAKVSRFATNNDSTINAYAINNTTGELTNVKGSPFTGSRGATRGIAADPSGQFLYVANSSDLLGHSINASNGGLTELSGSPFTAGSGPINVCVGGTIK